VREVLQDLGIDFKEEEMHEDALFRSDFYVPSADLVIEINGRGHCYPYTTRFNNFSNFKNKLLHAGGHHVLHLNSWKLEGMLRDPERVGLKDWISKSVKTGQEKTKARTQ